MFGLQKQRRNATFTESGAWFIAGHLTVFAKLSHHAVRLESRIFSSRCCFRVLRNLVPPPVSPFAVPTLSLLRCLRFLFLRAGATTPCSTTLRISREPLRVPDALPRPTYHHQRNGRINRLCNASFVRKKFSSPGTRRMKYSDLL